MKKVLAISSVLLGVVFLAGCGQQPVSQTQSTTPIPVVQQSSAIQNGTLESYVNTKYGYQISYDSKIYTINAFNSEPKVSQTSDSVLFFKIADLNSPEPLATVAINVFSNPQKLSSENYLKQNYQKWLGTPSNYSDFFINDSTTFNGLVARKFGTERDQYILIIKDDFALTITTGDPELIKTFKFTK
jgi:hypothetical protein